MQAQDSTAAPAASGMPRFDSQLVYQPSLRSRLGMLGISLGLIIVALAALPLVIHLIADPQNGPLGLRCVIMATWLVAVGYCLYMALTVRNRFVIGVDTVSLRDWRRTRTLHFEDIEGGSVTLEEIRQPRVAPTVHGARLTLRSRHAGQAPLSVIIDERRPIDAAIVERLKVLPALAPHVLKPLERMSRDRTRRR